MTALGELIEVPAGCYALGSESIREAEAPNAPHAVELPGCRLGKHPVTNGEYAEFVTATGASRPASWSEARFSGSAQPVVAVSWDEALAYCTWAGGTLPTEDQWEAAARGADARRYPWGEAEPDELRAHFARDWNSGATAPVGSHPLGAGPFGHLDLAGNVWEWCLDQWSTAPGATPNLRPLRGGCWRSIEPKLQAAYRNWAHRVARHVTIGFRLCRPR